MSNSLAIHTVYKPQENIDYLEEWLEYHSRIGFNKFYLYDNGDSLQVADSSAMVSKAPEANIYGYPYRYTLSDARKMQNRIISHYPVELIRWSPVTEHGQIGYEQVKSIIHLANEVSSGLVAFIDLDEFIIKREPFFSSRLLQKKYHNMHAYSSVTQIRSCVPDINTVNWNFKNIVDMSEYGEQLRVHGGKSIHMNELELPPTKNYFNHYNHNEIAHRGLERSINQIDPSFSMRPYDKIFVTETEDNDVIRILGATNDK